MFSRICIRRIIPTSIKMSKITVARSSNHFPYKYIASSINFPDVFIPHRLYTQQTKTEDMIADYEYVKGATGNNTVLIVDVREPEEIKEHGKIPNSINIPLGHVTTVLSAMSDNEFQNIYKRAKPAENTEIIFYCMIGKRSGMAQQNAVNLGYKNVKNYLGSWTDWASKAQ